MRRIVATFDDDDEAAGDAETALRTAGFEPREPDVRNPFFDPAAQIPERRGLLWGGLIGGLIGAVLLFALNQYVFWIPRISPIMTAGLYELIFLGVGLGVASGGFLGGVLGTIRQVPDRDQSRLTVTVPDDRIGEVENMLQTHGAAEISGVVTHHEHPQRTKMEESGS